MVRYFFDVVSRSRSEYDSQGTLLSDTNEARKWARLLAITLRVPVMRLAPGEWRTPDAI